MNWHIFFLFTYNTNILARFLSVMKNQKMRDPILVTATESLDLNFTTFCYIKEYITFLLFCS